MHSVIGKKIREWEAAKAKGLTATALELGLEALEVSLVLDNLDETLRKRKT